MNHLDSAEDYPEALPPAVQHARLLARTLPSELRGSTLTCPLCSAKNPARGLRARPLQGIDQGQWQIVYICPACGLITAFDAKLMTTQSLSHVGISHNEDWLKELRAFKSAPRSILPKQFHESGVREFVGTFILTFVTWMCLIGNFNPVEIAWGVLVSLLCARLTYRFAAISLPRWILKPQRLRALFALLIEFVRQLVIQNISLSMRVLNPKLTVRPGIVAVPTKLRGDVPLTLLGSLSTLTPDTVVIDIDQQRGIVYLHWIDVRSTDPDKAYQLISASLEEKIAKWLL